VPVAAGGALCHHGTTIAGTARGARGAIAYGMDGQYPGDGGDFPGECLCGSIDFERIALQRKPNAPITTDFVACLSCRAMFYVPLPPIVVTPTEGRCFGSSFDAALMPLCQKTNSTSDTMTERARMMIL